KDGELTVTKSQLSFQLRGTPEAPRASLQLGAAALAWQPSTTNPESTLTNLQFLAPQQKRDQRIDIAVGVPDGPVPLPDLPRLESVQVTAEVAPGEIKLEKFTAKANGQPIEATAVWPLPQGTWTALGSARKLPDWDQARGHLEVEGALLSAFAGYLPPL